MQKSFNRNFSKEETMMVTKHTKRCSNPVVIWEGQIKILSENNYIYWFGKTLK